MKLRKRKAGWLAPHERKAAGVVADDLRRWLEKRLQEEDLAGAEILRRAAAVADFCEQEMTEAFLS